jgi:hypothetical protein
MKSLRTISDEKKNGSSITLPYALYCSGFSLLGDDGDFLANVCHCSC